MKKRYMKLLGVALAFVSLTTTAHANNLTVNDYNTDSWDRFTYNYEFSTGVDYGEALGKATTTDIVVEPAIQNVRVNKDYAYAPTAYGFFSGEFATSLLNPYFTIPSSAGVTNTTNYADTTYTTSQNTSGTGGFLNSTSVLLTGSDVTDTVFGGSSNNVTVSYSDGTSVSIGDGTSVLYYDDGTIGTLYIEDLSKTLKVYEGETLANLNLAAAHFETTSSWNGNVGLAGHNDDEFKNIWNLDDGAIIKYTTKYGVREYAVVDVKKIAVTDFSDLEYTADNRLTLITCVQNSPDERYCVIAIEV